jgi:hypothetical protein
MSLHSWDEFALRNVFYEYPEVTGPLLEAIPYLVTLKRHETGVGFFSTLKGTRELPRRSASQSYRRQSTGQLFAFDVWLLDHGQGEIEAVVIGDGGEWPAEMSPSELDVD